MVTTGAPPARAPGRRRPPSAAAGIGAGCIPWAASGDDSPVGCAAIAAVSKASRDIARAVAFPLLMTSSRFVT